MTSFLQKIYIYTFLDSFILIAAIFALFFSKHGLNPYQISLLIPVWSIVTITLEVPTGILADKYSRRNLLIIASLLRAIGFVVWLMFPNFFGFAIGFVFWGLRNVLASGTFEAFVYDELKSLNSENFYEKALGKISGYKFLALTIATVIGGLLAEIDFNIVVIASIITSILSALVLFLIKPVRATKSTGEVLYLQILKDAIIQIKGNTSLFLLILFICLIFGTYGASEEFWSLIYDKFGFNVSVIGVLIAITYGIYSFAGYTAHFFSLKNTNNLYYVLIILAGIFYMIVGITKLPFLIPLIFIGAYLLQIASIKMEAQMQYAIKSEQRATISSLKSLLFEIIYMGFVVLFGYTSTILGITSILYLLGGLLILWIVLFKLLVRRL